MPVRPSQDNLARRVRRLEELLLRSHGVSSPPSPNEDNTPPSSSVENNDPARERTPQDLNGTLRVDDKGFVRFVPASLQWQSSRLALADDSSGIASISRYPLNPATTASMDDILGALPSQSYCSELVRVYFTSYASLFHVLHAPTFERQYERFVQGAHDMPLAWLALLFAILGTAVHALPSNSQLLDLSHQSRSLEKIEDLSSRYRSLAMRCLEHDHYLWTHNVTTLQALILLMYSINHSNGQTWTLLGLAHHLALSIGCHIDPSRFGLDVVQCEERRRCWAAVKMLYTQQNTAMGHIGITHVQFPSNCRPPADADDDCLLSGVMEDAVETPSISLRPTEMTYLLLKFRLYDICSDICESVLSKRYVDVDNIRRLDAVLQNEQQSWDSRFFSGEQSEEWPTPPQLAHINVLRSYAHHLTLLLHQQILLRISATDHDSTLRWSRLRCLDSAKSVLDIHAYVHDAPKLAPFRWFNRGVGSFHAFHAAVVLVMLRQKGMEEDCRESIEPALQDCFMRFMSMSELSPFCVKAAPLLQAFIEQIQITGQRNNGIYGGGSSNSILRHSLHEPGIALGANNVHSPDEARPLSRPTWSTSNRTTSTSDHRETSSSEDYDASNPNWDLLLSDMQPQQWLSPAVFPLDQWNMILANPI